MKRLLKVVGAVVVLVSLSGAASFFWASTKAQARFEKKYQTHRVDFPVPFPLTDSEKGSLTAGEDAGEVALERALRKGTSKDGRALRPPMAGMTAYAANITDTELKAMWAYLQTVPAKPDPTR